MCVVCVGGQDDALAWTVRDYIMATKAHFATETVRTAGLCVGESVGVVSFFCAHVYVDLIVIRLVCLFEFDYCLPCRVCMKEMRSDCACACVCRLILIWNIFLILI